MSECIRQCSLCDKLILSQSVTFDGTNLIVNLPANAYGNCEKYCVILAQAIPEETVINAPVVFTIGSDTATTYPFVNCNCTPIYASQVRTRRIYPSKVSTAIDTGVFKYVGKYKLPKNSATLSQTIPVIPDTVAPSL